MTDFINYPSYTKKLAKKAVLAKMEMTEKTQKIVEEELQDIDETTTETEVVQKINESKKAVARKTKKGVKVKQVLKG